MIAVVPRVLGALFYYSPNRDEAKAALAQLAELPELFAWQSPEEVGSLCQSLPNVDESVADDFSMLFEGLGRMPAPPWGSVYQEAENIVMGDSTLAYRQFLMSLNIQPQTEMNEPEDQFGLMMLALASLLEAENDDAVITLLEQHLLPWSGRYLELVSQTETATAYYSTLAKIAACFLGDLAKLLELTPRKAQLYF